MKQQQKAKYDARAPLYSDFSFFAFLTFGTLASQYIPTAAKMLKTIKTHISPKLRHLKLKSAFKVFHVLNAGFTGGRVEVQVFDRVADDF
jgi:hypothetical protein